MKSEHQQRVQKFMELAKQEIPAVPTLPSPEVARLRASLILEEALELIDGLGCQALIERHIPVVKGNYMVVSTHEPDLVEISDGCADCSVILQGTLLSAGIPDKKLLEIVDGNNLEKFGEGHSFRSDGKLVKSPSFVGPTEKIKEYLESLKA